VSTLTGPSPHTCGCAATVHPLWMNCLGCGKILCHVEAGTVCNFCAAELPRTGPLRSTDLSALPTLRRRAMDAARERELAGLHVAGVPVAGAPGAAGGSGKARGGGTLAAAPPPTTGPGKDGGVGGGGVGGGEAADPSLHAAIAHKDRLLEFDRTSAARTHV
jgi:hypothetical protein